MTRSEAERSERMATPADWNHFRGRHAAIPADRTDAWQSYRDFATVASIPAGSGRHRAQGLTDVNR